MSGYFATGCLEYFATDLNSMNGGKKFLCVSKSTLKPLVLLVKSDALQIWSDGCNDRVMLATKPLPRNDKDTVDITSYHAVWHPSESTLFAILYEGVNLAVFSLSDELVSKEGRYVNSRVRHCNIKCLYYLNFGKQNMICNASSIMAFENDIFIAANNKLAARLSWSCALKETYDCSKSIKYFSYGPVLECVAMVMTNGEVWIYFLPDKLERNLVNAFSTSSENQNLLLISTIDPERNKRATTISIDEKCLRIAVGYINGDVCVYCLQENTYSKINNSVSNKSSRRVSATIYSKMSLQEQVENCNFFVGSVSAMEWAVDGQAVAAGYSRGGFAVWSPFGTCLFSTLSCVSDVSTSINFSFKVGFKHPEIQNVVALTWLSSSFSLLAAISQSQDARSRRDYKALNWSLVVAKFLKSIDTSHTAIFKLHYPVLMGPTAIYRYNHHRRRKKWQKLRPLKDYINSNAPLKHCSVSPSASRIAIAGSSGFVIFEESTKVWRTLSDSNDESNFCCLGLLWLNDSILVCSQQTMLTIWDVAKLKNRKKILTIPIQTDAFSVYKMIPVTRVARRFFIISRIKYNAAKLNMLLISLSYTSDARGSILKYTTRKVPTPFFDNNPILKLCYIPGTNLIPKYDCNSQINHGNSFDLGFFMALHNNGKASFAGANCPKKVYDVAQEIFLNIWYADLSLENCPVSLTVTFWMYEKRLGLHVLVPAVKGFRIKRVINIYAKHAPLGVISYSGRFVYCVSGRKLTRHTRRPYFAVLGNSFSFNVALILIYLKDSNTRMVDTVFYKLLDTSTSRSLLQILVEHAYGNRHLTNSGASFLLLQRVLKMLRNEMKLYVKVICRSARLIEKSRWVFIFPYAGNPCQLYNICIKYKDIISGSMYMNILCESGIASVNNIHKSTIITKTIETGTKLIRKFMKHGNKNSALDEELKLFLERISIKHVVSVREYFHTSDMHRNTG